MLKQLTEAVQELKLEQRRHTISPLVQVVDSNSHSPRSFQCDGWRPFTYLVEKSKLVFQMSPSEEPSFSVMVPGGSQQIPVQIIRSQTEWVSLIDQYALRQDTTPLWLLCEHSKGSSEGQIKPHSPAGQQKLENKHSRVAEKHTSSSPQPSRSTTPPSSSPPSQCSAVPRSKNEVSPAAPRRAPSYADAVGKALGTSLSTHSSPSVHPTTTSTSSCPSSCTPSTPADTPTSSPVHKGKAGPSTVCAVVNCNMLRQGHIPFCKDHADQFLPGHPSQYAEASPVDSKKKSKQQRALEKQRQKQVKQEERRSRKKKKKKEAKKSKGSNSLTRGVAAMLTRGTPTTSSSTEKKDGHTGLPPASPVLARTESKVGKSLETELRGVWRHASSVVFKVGRNLSSLYLLHPPTQMHQ